MLIPILSGRLHVARQAAQNLRFGRVTLDPSRPEVPTLLDLDQLVHLERQRIPACRPGKDDAGIEKIIERAH